MFVKMLARVPMPLRRKRCGTPYLRKEMDAGFSASIVAVICCGLFLFLKQAAFSLTEGKLDRFCSFFFLSGGYVDGRPHSRPPSMQAQNHIETVFTGKEVKMKTQKHLKHSVPLLCTVLALALLLAACGGTAPAPATQAPAQTQTAAPQTQAPSAEAPSPAPTQAPAPEKETWTFTDQADNEVTVQLPIERMVVLQHHSIDIICQLGGQDKIVGVEEKWSKNLGSYIADIWPEIKEMPTCGSLSAPNVEAVAALNPDVVIVASQADQDACAQLRDMGIPVCVVSLRGEGKQAEAQNPRLANADAAYTEGCQWAVKTLGRLTGRDAQADALWAFCEESRQMVEDAVGSIADADRIRAVTVMNNNAVYGNDKYVGCMLLRAGGINAAAADIQGNGTYTVETLANWDPDVIITQDRYPEVYTELTTSPEYAELRCVKEGNVILAPYWTKPWGNPDADSMALGELWLAWKFYPDKVSEETVLNRAKEFYETFYGVPFTGTLTPEIP